MLVRLWVNRRALSLLWWLGLTAQLGFTSCSERARGSGRGDAASFRDNSDSGTQALSLTEAASPERPVEPLDAAPSSGGTSSLVEPESTSGGNGSVTEEPSQLRWGPTGELAAGVEIEEAELMVPFDYSSPESDSCSLPLLRLPAAGTAQGVLMFNPGGPGPALLQDGKSYLEWLSSLAPNMDLVLMDNRGTGRSAPFRCWTPAEAETYLSAPYGETKEEQLNNRSELVGALFASCQRQLGDRLGDYVTENIARDMDRVRAALGAERLNYLGVSYGTLQGAIYAKLFPERVGRWILDSPVYRGWDRTPNLAEKVISDISPYDEQLLRFFAECDATDSCTPREVEGGTAGAYELVRGKLGKAVVVDGQRLEPEFLDYAAVGLLREGNWDGLAALITIGLYEEWSLLADGMASEAQDPQLAVDEFVGNLVMNALDHSCPSLYSRAQSNALYDGLVEAAPWLGESWAGQVADCESWSYSIEQQEVVPDDLTSPPILVISNPNDPATPAIHGERLVAQFRNGSIQFTADAEGHGVVGTSECGITVIKKFLAEGDIAAIPADCVETSSLKKSQDQADTQLMPRPRRDKSFWWAAAHILR